VRHLILLHFSLNSPSNKGREGKERRRKKKREEKEKEGGGSEFPHLPTFFF